MISDSSNSSDSRSDDPACSPIAMTSPLWSIRMRASKLAAKGSGQRTGNCIPIPGPQPPIPDIHISGAETICSGRGIRKTVQEYIDRAATHPRGKPDKIEISIEQLKKNPRVIPALPVMTAINRAPSGAEAIISRLLGEAGVSEKAIASAFLILKGREVMRGAGLVLASSGRRVEPDRQRGVRASRFGIAKPAEKMLSAELGRQGLNTETVREAVALASKVASCRDVVAEVCVSDDPDYTTGYAATASRGYVRIPHIKKKRDRRGSRIFFIRENADIRRLIQYLEKIPVIIAGTMSCSGEETIDEILDRTDK